MLTLFSLHLAIDLTVNSTVSYYTASFTVRCSVSCKWYHRSGLLCILAVPRIEYHTYISMDKNLKFNKNVPYIHVLVNTQ